MKMMIACCSGVIAGAWVCLAATNGVVRVNAERVNLRARPVADSEVVAQAVEGDRLTVVRVDGDWAAVRAPTNAETWVKAEFVKDGVAASERLNIRCGPGLSYRMVGSLRSGDHLAVVATRGEWVRIVPPSDLLLWVSRSLVGAPMVAETNRVEESGAVVGGKTTIPAVSGIAATNVLLSRELPAGLTADELAPVLGQGAVIGRQGMLERVPMAFLRGVEFRLVGMVEGRKATICYLRGSEERMRLMVGQHVTVRGRGYWLGGERSPLVYADELLAVAEARP